MVYNKTALNKGGVDCVYKRTKTAPGDGQKTIAASVLKVFIG